jgi:NTP pyrophosphatase (non-canonical NTP hydrolase)
VTGRKFRSPPAGKSPGAGDRICHQASAPTTTTIPNKANDFISPSAYHVGTVDTKTSIDEAKKWVKDFCDARDWDDPHTAKDLAIGLVTEASELLEIFRFVPPGEEARVLEKDRTHIGDELADSFYFLLRFAERFNFDLADCLAQKMEKNAVRYPPKKRS